MMPVTALIVVGSADPDLAETRGGSARDQCRDPATLAAINAACDEYLAVRRPFFRPASSARGVPSLKAIAAHLVLNADPPIEWWCGMGGE